jgi:fucose permease
MKKTSIVLLIIFLVFIGLGLPDALLGSSWNLVKEDLQVPLGYIGITTFTAFFFTVITTFLGPYFLSVFQTKQIVLVSLILSSIGIFSMSQSSNYLGIIVSSIPLGIGAGAIDFSINHYVAIHYKAKHMNYLHSFYGVGVLIGPMIMAMTLQEEEWRLGFLIVSGLLILIALSVLLSSKLWHEESEEHRQEHHTSVSVMKALQTRGAILSILIFFLYVFVESLFGLLIASFFYITRDISYSTAAIFTLVYYSGLAMGRFISGMVSDMIHPNRLIQIGGILMLIGVVALLIDTPLVFSFVFVLLIGLGSGPIYPNMMHMNEHNFDTSKMSRIMSLQMTIAYISFGLVTPLMGFVFQWTSIASFPYIACASIFVLSILIFIFTRLFQEKTVN